MSASPVKASAGAMIESFSKREKEIIGELLEARSVKEIALELHLSVNTVKDYLKTVYEKAEVHSARELLVKLYSDREVSPPPGLSSLQLIASMEKLLDSRHPDDVVDRLLVAARSCTTAGRATFWTAQRDGTDWVLSSYPAGRVRLHLSSVFLQTVLSTGFSQLQLDDPMAAAERRRIESLALQTEVIGLRVSFPARTGLLLLTDPQHERFSETDMSAARLFGRVAETALQALSSVVPGLSTPAAVAVGA